MRACRKMTGEFWRCVAYFWLAIVRVKVNFVT